MATDEQEESYVSPHLQKSRQEVAATVKRVVEKERRRNEARVAIIRLMAYSLVFFIDLAMYLAGVRKLGNVLAPAALIAIAAFLILAVRRWYRPWFGYVVPVLDALFIIQMITDRVARLGAASPSLIATAALSCGLFAATGAIRFDRRIAAYTTALSLVVLWATVGVNAESSGMLYTVVALIAIGMINLWLAELARQAISGSLGRLLLRRFVQGSVVDKAFSNPAALLSKPRTLEATVLVSDLRGFTALSEKLKPSVVLSLLTEVQSALATVVHRHGGTVDKFIGDGMLAVFGAPEPIQDHAQKAVTAAMEMREAVRQVSARHPDLPPFRVGIGIHTGTLIAGVLGSGDRMEFTVIGDTVNTASRLEAMTKEYRVGVLLSGTTAAQIKDVPVKELGNASVRGRSGKIPLFALDDDTENVSSDGL